MSEPARVHIFTAPMQPATRFKIDVSMNQRHRWIQRYHKRRQLWCWKCEQRRWAQNLTVQVFFDDIRFWCAPGKGCKKKRKAMGHVK